MVVVVVVFMFSVAYEHIFDHFLKEALSDDSFPELRYE